MSNTNKDPKHLLEEYRILREEIIFFMNKDTTLFSCLFTSVTAVLFFALQWKIPEGCILTFLIIIPIGSKFAYHQKEMAKISAYMKYYLEKNISIKWETFISELSTCPNRPKTAKYLKFSECIMMAIASILVYAYLVWQDEIWKNHEYIFKIESVILIILFIWTIFISKNIYSIKDYRNSYEKLIKNIQL